MVKYLVTEMSWENMFLNITIRSKLKGARFMFVQLGGRTYYVRESDTSSVEDGYKLKINISASAGRGFLPDGCWNLVASVDGVSHEVRTTFDVAYKFQDLSRVYRYTDDKAFLITFEPEGGNGEVAKGFDIAHDRELDGSIGFVFHSSFMSSSKHRIELRSA